MDQNDSLPDVSGRAFAGSVRALLNEDWRRYRNFGIYWFFVKALLKRFFDRNQVPLLGDFTDPTVNERIPQDVRAAGGQAMLMAAILEYLDNSRLNLGRNQVEDADGEFFVLMDPDIEG